LTDPQRNSVGCFQEKSGNRKGPSEVAYELEVVPSGT
jgi:hypothetical protein